ncbi:MAG: response regulator [Niastella sp.]|uniref:response regulator n=1 Tax=Niastella sp. TaxID=1869183 RepID=UPI003899F8A0
MQLIHSVMIIDDDDDDRMLFSEALTEVCPSCILISASNGKEALELLQRSDITLPGLIFLDLNMPCMNGMQCLNQLRKCASLRNIPVIMYTTTQMIDSFESFQKFAPVFFLTKPNRYKDIVQTLSYLLNNTWWKDEKILKEKIIQIS